MEKVTAYLCDKLSGKIECTNFEGEISAVSVADGVVKAKLWPKEPVPGCRIEGGEIIAQLLKENDSRYVCVYGEYLTWEREETLDATGDPVGLKHYITIEIENPDHCHWIGSAILIFGADFNIFGRLFASVQVGSGGDPCPEDKDDVFSGGGQTQFLMTQNQIVPGEAISLKNYFWDGQNATEEFVDAEWLCTCCFTGGEVKAINGDYGDTDITYTVGIQGVNRTCVPSDFVEYEVGDWVFVLAPNSTCAECGRKENCKEGCEESSNYMILPMKVGSYGA